MDQERVFDVGENHSFCFCMCDLISFQQTIFVQSFERKVTCVVFFPYQANFAKGTTTQNFQDREVINVDFSFGTIVQLHGGQPSFDRNVGKGTGEVVVWQEGRGEREER